MFDMMDILQIIQIIFQDSQLIFQCLSAVSIVIPAVCLMSISSLKRNEINLHSENQ